MWEGGRSTPSSLGILWGLLRPRRTSLLGVFGGPLGSRAQILCGIGFGPSFVRTHQEWAARPMSAPMPPPPPKSGDGPAVPTESPTSGPRWAELGSDVNRRKTGPTSSWNHPNLEKMQGAPGPNMAKNGHRHRARWLWPGSGRNGQVEAEHLWTVEIIRS